MESKAEGPLRGLRARLLAGLSPKGEVFSVLLLMVAFLPRLYVAIAWAREPVWDGHYYHFGAERIAEGFGYSEDVMIDGKPVSKPWTHYPVGYSALLGFVYRLFGSGNLVAPLVNVVVGTLLAWLAYLVAKEYLSEGRARLAGLLVAAHPGLITYTALVMTELTAACSMLLAAWLALRRRDSWHGVISCGVATALASLVRPTAILVIPLLVFVFSNRGLWSGLKRTAVAGAVTLAVIAPWSIRNCLVMDGCALVSTNAGWNLAIGVVADTGRFQTLRASDGCAIVTGQVQQDRCWMDVGIARIKANPIRWIGLMPAKLSHTFSHESFAAGYLKEADPERWPEAKAERMRVLLTMVHLIVTALATLVTVGVPRPLSVRRAGTWVQLALALVIGAYAVHALFFTWEHPVHWLVVAMPVLAVLPLPGRPSQGPAGSMLIGLVAMTALTHAVFFGEDRYHLVITPLFCILLAGALRRSESSGASLLTRTSEPSLPEAPTRSPFPPERVPGASAPPSP